MMGIHNVFPEDIANNKEDSISSRKLKKGDAA
jgi:hypothetical protein